MKADEILAEAQCRVSRFGNSGSLDFVLSSWRKRESLSLLDKRAKSFARLI